MKIKHIAPSIRSGEVMDVPDHLAVRLCEVGLAIPVRSDADDVETRAHA